MQVNSKTKLRVRWTDYLRIVEVILRLWNEVSDWLRGPLQLVGQYFDRQAKKVVRNIFQGQSPHLLFFIPLARSQAEIWCRLSQLIQTHVSPGAHDIWTWLRNQYLSFPKPRVRRGSTL